MAPLLIFEAPDLDPERTYQPSIAEAPDLDRVWPSARDEVSVVRRDGNAGRPDAPWLQRAHAVMQAWSAADRRKLLLVGRRSTVRLPHD